ncbi:hydroxysqualene dehydroxylase HpnE [Glaciimonas soli]|uniref:FAD-dependent oxidoreductase n=1 Tax=Glaciimonas soli TaxID=2590999 RepID=A0A843YVI7_9BURK|nr:hydroxysqualene dehydroxylase HpnE [Glaciimonas soli]MQR01508.1 FAD-dependent oxidoreductase [Glaciimonas soli]
MSAGDSKKIAVIGAGWAGCAAAVALTEARHQVTLFEAARVLGGRARRVDVNDVVLDNGQHIMLGAYQQSLQLMRTVGIAEHEALLRLPMQMCYPDGTDGMTFEAARLPAPFHLAVALWRAKGLQRDDKLALARFSSAARWMGWQLYDDCSVSTLLERFAQTERLCQLMWRPLCIAALNTPPERASAQVFLAVLRDSLGARRAASDMLIPRVDLSALMPDHAAKFIAQHGGKIELGCSVKKINPITTNLPNSNRWQVITSNVQEKFDAIIIATPAETAAHLLDGIENNSADTSLLKQFTYEPITTCYLQYASTVQLSQAFFALVDDQEKGHWGQFVFDRGQLDATQAGLFAVVISASSAAIADGHETLIAAAAKQLAQVFQRPELAQPIWSKVISEKRATFACAPSLVRPSNDSGISGIYLAGDYTIGDYPATLESAVRSGNQAAKELIATLV